ncbi:MAG: hypothetical protein ACOYIS_07415 [Candidatus Cloacimonadaceae bacterium]|jgi:hypothetical protein
MKNPLINWLELSDRELDELLDAQVSACLYRTRDDEPPEKVPPPDQTNPK